MKRFTLKDLKENKRNKGIYYFPNSGIGYPEETAKNILYVLNEGKVGKLTDDIEVKIVCTIFDRIKKLEKLIKEFNDNVC